MKTKTKTHAGLAPALALRRFAAVAAVLLAFCLVFMMPVGATERPADLPTATVKELADGEGPTEFDLTFARNFTADYVTPEQLSTYGQWYADFILTTNKEMTVGTNGETSGYLAGNYGDFGWLKVPDKDGLGSLDNVEIPANTAMPVMASALGMQKYSYIYESVQTFLCGMYLNSGFLENNPDIVITLELRMINPDDVPEDLDMNVIMEKSFVIGDSYEFALEWTLTCKDEDGSSLLYKEGESNPTTYTVLTPTFTLAEPVKMGYVFDGWKDAEGQVHKTVSIEEGTYEDKTYTATWKKLHSITINANGGDGIMTAEPVIAGESFFLPDCTFTAPEGKVFKAWQIGKIEYAAGVSYTVPGDIEVTAVWKDVGGAVAPSFDEAVAKVNDNGTTEIDTTGENVEPDSENKKVTVTDQSTGVTIEVQYDEVDFGESTAVGTVEEITVTYPENQVAASADADSTEEVITQRVSFQLDTLTTVLPQITSIFDEEKAQKITEKPKFKGHKPFAMITADNADAVNTNMTKNSVTVEFRVPKTLVDKLVNGNLDLLRGYHITIEDGKEVVKEIEISTPVLNGDDYIIKLTGNGFSSYVLGYEEPQTNIGNTGSATDTGSGNYQYYPRDVPASGIISFGTSKVVTGMELPAGSDGKVTLNIKPDFDMPENGYYAFEIDAPGYNLDAKINGGLTFQIPVSELEAAGFTAEDIFLFHGTAGEDGKITWEALPTNLVKNENGIAYYKAAINGCSPFYIGFVKNGAIINEPIVEPTVPETPVTPNEPETLPPADTPETPETPASPAPILAILAGLGAVAALRRK